MPELSLRPGMRLGAYPERREQGGDEIEAAAAQWLGGIRSRLNRKRFSLRRTVRAIERHDRGLDALDEAKLRERVEDLRARLRVDGLQESLLAEAFAVVREVSGRVLGMRHFDEQLYGGWLMANGMIAEMQTGEGKTLTTALPACAAALAGIPVHIITANDYLAARDCEILLPLYRWFDLSGSAVTDGMPIEQCREAYRADIVHTTNKQVAFDYLRDRIEIGEDKGDLRFRFRQIEKRRAGGGNGNLMLRGLCFAIIDEADSVLIDEAVTPLIITRALPNAEPSEVFGDALYLASLMQAERDFRADVKTRHIELTPVGEDRLEENAGNLGQRWRNRRMREHLVRQALAANLYYQRDRDYIVSEDKVLIIDQSTGRTMPDRSWEQGLQQIIEVREGCVVSDQREPQARISYQRFFGRYLRLGGASGTVTEVSAELRRVYGLELLKVPTHRPTKRIMFGERIYRNADDQRLALTTRARALSDIGRPLLIGTCSVAESESVGRWLSGAGIKHRVLNARQDREEAEIIAAAGQRGAVTVATNMAGRGTDISLGPGVEELGGLHVISLALNASYRVDRQLYGRSARQGDPGSAEAILCLEDEAIIGAIGAIGGALVRGLTGPGKPAPRWIGTPLLRQAQRRYEARQARQRRALIKQDRRLQRTLAFAGKFE